MGVHGENPKGYWRQWRHSKNSRVHHGIKGCFVLVFHKGTWRPFPVTAKHTSESAIQSLLNDNYDSLTLFVNGKKEIVGHDVPQPHYAHPPFLTPLDNRL